MMNDKVSVEQKSNFGSETTQIAVQNNYYGLSPEKAAEMAIELFYQNFPKLEADAEKIVNKRVTELTVEILKNLKKCAITDISAFSDPDVQYILYEAQKNYARFGTENMLFSLSQLITNRIKSNEGSMRLKVTIDKAIEAVPLLNEGQLDLLSLIFFSSRAVNSNIHTVDELKVYLDKISYVFRNADFSSFSYLYVLGCLQFSIHDPIRFYARGYHIKENAIESICPEIIKKTFGDYSVSDVGITIAVINAELKLEQKFDLTVWVQ